MDKLATEKPIYTIPNYIYSFLLTNIYFLLSNILFIIVYLFMYLTPETTLFLFISLIPLGPSIGALLYSMGKLVREKEISPTKDYFTGYTKNFKLSFIFGLIQLIFIFVLMINSYIMGEQSILSTFYLVLMALVLIIGCYGFPILSRFDIAFKNLYLVSIYSVFKYWKRTLINIVGIALSLWLYIVYPVLSIFLLTSGLGFLLMFNLKNILKQLEDGNFG